MRRISTKIALPLLLGLASIVAVACAEENPDPDGEGGSGGGSSDIGDGGGEPSTGGKSNDGSGGGNTDGTGGANTDGSGGDGGEGGDGTGGGTGGIPDIPPPVDNELDPCEDEPNETVSGGPIDGEDCWDFTVCEGVDTPHFLNQCSGTCFEPFDNFDRIVGFTGTLPPL